MIDISLLLSNVKDEIEVNESIQYDNSYYENTDIIDTKNIKVIGNIKKNSISEIELNFDVTGIMVLPCAITLEPVNYPFSFKINEIIDENDENNLKKDENTIELKQFLWQNIVVEIPLRVVSENAYKEKKQGNGWKLITDEKEKSGNRPLEGLKQLLDKE